MKYIRILIILIVVIAIGSTQVEAMSQDRKVIKVSETTTIGGGGVNANGFSSSTINGLDLDAYKPGKIQNADSLLVIGNTIIGIIQFVGSIVSIIIVIVVGIKYMIGSIEEKAEYKKTMMAYVIGAILLFSITNVVKIVSDVASSLQNI